MGAVRGDLINAVRRELAKAGDPERARGQQAYMKSTMPFRGVTSPQLRAALRPVLADPGYRLTGRDEWEGTIRGLWDGARFREERYAALAVSGHRLYRQWARDRSAMPLYHYLVESGAWWDFVDDIASHRVGPVLRAHPESESDRAREPPTGSAAA
jgi:3-methyladenine DNA glycosylase AlkD